jgi:hypothetical protein
MDTFHDDTAPTYLLRDRDAIYGDSFRQRVRGMQIQEASRLPEALGGIPSPNQGCAGRTAGRATAAAKRGANSRSRWPASSMRPASGIVTSSARPRHPHHLACPLTDSCLHLVGSPRMAAASWRHISATPVLLFHRRRPASPASRVAARSGGWNLGEGQPASDNRTFRQQALYPAMLSGGGSSTTDGYTALRPTRTDTSCPSCAGGTRLRKSRRDREGDRVVFDVTRRGPRRPSG